MSAGRLRHTTGSMSRRRKTARPFRHAQHLACLCGEGTGDRGVGQVTSVGSIEGGFRQRLVLCSQVLWVLSRVPGAQRLPPCAHGVSVVEMR